MAAHAVAGNRHAGKLSRLGHFFLHELRGVIPPTLFFFVGFNLVLFTKRLFLADYLIEYTGFLVATTAALIVGKTVLVADTIPWMKRFDGAPLAYPILFKTGVYTFFVFVARLLEAFIHYWIEGGAVGHGGFLDHTLGTFTWPHFIATQLWIFVLFLVYVTASELNQLFGDGELFKIFFTRRLPELKTTRRARIRLLVRLARLTDAHSVAELADPHTPPHRELVAILSTLAGDGVSEAKRAA
ncbi:MAG TPA: hypothetical protein VGF34_06255 [Stellaceae bacterium]|jgi:hypothetical protein